MNPQSDQTPGLRLPQPSFDLGQAATSNTPQPSQASQLAPMQSQTPGVASNSAVAAIQAQAASMSQPLAAVPSAMPIQEPIQNDSESALDQEWVLKAREAVSRTHTDPYLESDVLGKLKSEYIRARYNKDIKVTED